MKKKILVGWVEPNWKKQWRYGFPFKLWKNRDKENGDIKIRIILELPTPGEKRRK